MSRSIKYGNDNRRAVLDLVQWLGFRASLGVMRQMRRARTSLLWSVPAGLRMAFSLAGVSGFPVTATWRRWAMGVK